MKADESLPIRFTHGVHCQLAILIMRLLPIESKSR